MFLEELLEKCREKGNEMQRNENLTVPLPAYTVRFQNNGMKWKKINARAGQEINRE
jgi:hypothetical protein